MGRRLWGCWFRLVIWRRLIDFQVCLLLSITVPLNVIFIFMGKIQWRGWYRPFIWHRLIDLNDCISLNIALYLSTIIILVSW